MEIPALITAVEFYRKFGYDYKNGAGKNALCPEIRGQNTGARRKLYIFWRKRSRKTTGLFLQR